MQNYPEIITALTKEILKFTTSKIFHPSSESSWKMYSLKIRKQTKKEQTWNLGKEIKERGAKEEDKRKVQDGRETGRPGWRWFKAPKETTPSRWRSWTPAVAKYTTKGQFFQEQECREHYGWAQKKLRKQTRVVFFFNQFIYFNWRLIILQYCSGFRQALKWISHG